jgi:hypothetical protein
VEALTQALRLANEEVVSLRQQCDDLRSLTHGLHFTGNRPLDSPIERPMQIGSPASGISSLDLPHPVPSNTAAIDLPPEVENMTGDQARQTLAVRNMYHHTNQLTMVSAVYLTKSVTPFDLST